MDNLNLVLIAFVVLALGAALYFYMEHQARTLRTRVVDVPGGGLRFEAHGFSFEVQRSIRQVKVVCDNGQLQRAPLAGGPSETQKGRLDATLPAPGLLMEVARWSLKTEGQEAVQATGLCTITLHASDALTHAAANLPGGTRSVLTMERIPEPVALAFNAFAGRVRIWVAKQEKLLERDRIERVRKEQEAAQAAEDERLLAQARADKAPEGPLNEADREALAAVQIDKWRKTAGFSGTSSEVSIDAQGRVDWFIDLAQDGRVTLHADKRTIHSTLHGASIASLGGELEIGVRDDYWSEEEPSLRFFKIFKGLPPDERRAWKERLDLVRDSLGKDHSREKR